MKLAVVIPHKNRESYKNFQKEYLTSYLKNQDIDHKVIFCEQKNNRLFNKAVTINFGVKYALDSYQPDYIVMNDVDLVPLNLDYLYQGYAEVWFGNAGGIKVLTSDFLLVNGFNNTFEGWGYEDSEFWYRLDVMGVDTKVWKDTVSNAEMIDLEMLQTDGLSYSQNYFGTTNPPRFYNRLDKEITSHITETYPKTWLTADIQKQNGIKCDKIKELPKEEAKKYFKEVGFNQISADNLTVDFDIETVAEVSWE